MFHILVARFLLEANENIPKKCDLNDVSLHFGQDCVAHLQLGDVFDRPDVTLVPALDANAGSNGVMKRTAFEYIESTICRPCGSTLPNWMPSTCTCTEPARWRASAPATIIS